MSKRSTRPSRFSQARSHELNDAYMEEFETGFEELRLANGGSKRNTSQANKKSNGYESTSGRQQLVQHNRGKANSAARKVGIGFRHGYEINSKHLAHGWKRGPSNTAGNLFDASDRNILCMILREIYGRYLLVSGLDEEIGHDAENFIERNGDEDFLCSNKFYFAAADAETRSMSLKYLSDVFNRLDERTGKKVECLTMFYFLQLYRSLWETDRDVVYNHLKLHGWYVLPYTKIEYVNRGLGEKGSLHFAVHFRDHLPVREINFSGNNLGKCSNLHILIMAFGSLRHLEKVNLSDNNIILSNNHKYRRKNSSLISSLQHCVKHRAQTLKSLDLSCNQISGIYIEKILTVKNGLNEINFSNNNLNCDDCVAIGRGISATPGNLQKISLRHNKIKSIGVAAISCGIKERTLKTIEYLDLSYNPLGSPGAVALGNLVHDNNYIKTILVKDCQLTYFLPSDPRRVTKRKDAEGILKFVGCLGYNTSITSLDLSYNYCHNQEKEGADIGQKIGRLMTLGNLTSVDISWMNLGTKAINFIADSLYDASYFEQIEKIKLNLKNAMDEIEMREWKEMDEYKTLYHGPIKGPQLVKRKMEEFNTKDQEIVENMNTILAGMNQKRILKDAGQEQLDRLKHRRDKLYVDNQNKLYILQEKNRSVDLRHDMRMNNFAKEKERETEKFNEKLDIFKKLRSRITLTYLNVESNDVGRDGIVQLGKALKQNPSITELKVGGNSYGRGKSFTKFSQLIGERVAKSVLSKISSTIVKSKNNNNNGYTWDFNSTAKEGKTHLLLDDNRDSNKSDQQDDTNSVVNHAAAHLPSSINLKKVWDNLIDLNLSNQRLMCNDGIVLGNILRYNGSHVKTLCTLDLSNNFLWHTISSRTRGNVAGFNEIFNFVRVAKQLVRLNISDNLVESEKDADSVAQAISRAIGVVMFKRGQTNFIPTCPLQWLGMQRCGIPSSKQKYESLCRDVERTWALRFFHEALTEAYNDFENGRGFKFLPGETLMPLTISGRTDGEIALHILSSHSNDISIDTWNKYSRKFYKVVCNWKGKPCHIDIGIEDLTEGSNLTVAVDSKLMTEHKRNGAFLKTKRTVSRQFKDGHYPFDYKHHRDGYDVPEYGEHKHIRDSNNRAIQTLSKALQFASDHWNEGEEDPIMKTKLITPTSPIKRRRSKGKRLHKLNVSI